jgi:hypothetical protein
MNAAALAIADRVLLDFPIVTLPTNKVLYHGARSTNIIVGFRPNAMFTSDLFYAVDYAFKRDTYTHNNDGTVSWRNDLLRSLFCCTLEEDIEVVKITGVNWPGLCMDIKRADDSMPDFDGWLQRELTSYLAMRYGGQVRGAMLFSGSNGALDEYIFNDASSIFSIYRRID